MNYIEILLLALALSMDAFSVALMAGLKGCSSLRQTLRLAGAFGFFQFAMPLAGWLLAGQAQNFIAAFDHWVAFGLLTLVGGKMLWDAKDLKENDSDPTLGGTLLILAIATSIDALAVGVSFAALNVNIFTASLIIGIVCFGVSFLGAQLSARLALKNERISTYANVLGGIILIAIGVKILFEHGVFAF